MTSGIWGTRNDTGVWMADAPQQAVAASFMRITHGDRAMVAQLLEAMGSHLLVTASEQIISPPFQGYARTLISVAHRMHRDVERSETPIRAGVIVETQDASTDY